MLSHTYLRFCILMIELLPPRQDIVNEPGFAFSACELTKSTGLSLTETLVREAGEGEGIEELVGEATCFFSYSWTGTKLRDLLAAIERVLAKLEAADGKRHYVWVDILCASQNLLQGVIKDPDLSSAEVGIEDAISTASELLFYMEPLSEREWAAPAHPFLLADQGEPEAGWMRRGPAALTRAWCIFELAKSLSKECTLHVLLSETSVAEFEGRMRSDNGGFLWIGEILDRIGPPAIEGRMRRLAEPFGAVGDGLDLLGEFFRGEAFLPHHPRPARLYHLARVRRLVIVGRDRKRDQDRRSANGSQFRDG